MRISGGQANISSNVWICGIQEPVKKASVLGLTDEIWKNLTSIPSSTSGMEDSEEQRIRSPVPVVPRPYNKQNGIFFFQLKDILIWF